jgi:hypothetical protein
MLKHLKTLQHDCSSLSCSWQIQTARINIVIVQNKKAGEHYQISKSKKKFLKLMMR